jgi:hypothetical protein
MAKSGSMKEWGKDKTSFANLPQEVTMKQYPRQDAINSDLDDTLEGIDEVVEHGKGKVKKHPSSQK